MSELLSYQKICEEITCRKAFIPGNNRKNKISDFCCSACYNKTNNRNWRANHKKIKGKWYPNDKEG